MNFCSIRIKLESEATKKLIDFFAPVNVRRLKEAGDPPWCQLQKVELALGGLIKGGEEILFTIQIAICDYKTAENYSLVGEYLQLLKIVGLDSDTLH